MFLSKLRIRAKLTILVTIPLLALVALAVPVVGDRLDDADRAADAAQKVRVTGQVSVLLRELDREQFQAGAFAIGFGTRSRLVKLSAQITARIADLQADLAEAGDLTPELIDALDKARSLGTLRAAVLAGRATHAQISLAYQEVTGELIDAIGLLDKADVTTSIGRQMVALDALLRANAASGTAGVEVVALMGGDQMAATRVAAASSSLQANNLRFVSYATEGQKEAFDLFQKVVQQRWGGRADLTTRRVDTGTVAEALPMLIANLESATTLRRYVDSRVVNDVVKAATEEQREATRLAYAVSVGTAAVMLLALLLSLMIGRSVARPLTRLTSAADQVTQVAEAELTRVADDEIESTEPVRLQQVGIEAKDEIGDLARAFDRVQRTAARLVERQVASRRNVAQMFGHIGRRTQNLVGRQLALIDGLERNEVDTNRLRDLYRLDHLSSRLRRNAGSLVVLSGGASGDDHPSPLPLGDVVRLALGEIEDYPRIDIEIPRHLGVVPSLVGDLVLILAELMENATTFSPPHTRVGVLAEPFGHGVRLLVVDHGIGMPEERLAQENARLTQRERLDLAPTEVLGLFVVGRLSRRHGLTVTLGSTPGGGVTASVVLGQEHLTGAPVATALPAGPSTGRMNGHPVEPRALHGPRHADPMGPDGLGGPGQPGNSLQRRDEAAWASAGAAGQDAQLFDLVALNRATQAIATSGSWNAFTPPGRRNGQPQLGPGALNHVPNGTLSQPRNGSPVTRPAPSTGSESPPPMLRRRVPGAQLPADLAGSPNVNPEPPAPNDPAEARALVESIEAGVRQAERESATAPSALTTPLPSSAPPSSAPSQGHLASPSAPPAPSPLRSVPETTESRPEPSAPSVSSPSASSDSDRRGAHLPPVPGLTRRVPGATLTGPNAPRSPSHSDSSALTEPTLDPDAARALVEQFESGVSRALRAVAEHPQGEGTPQ